MKTSKLVILVAAIAVINITGGDLLIGTTNHTEQAIGFIITAIGNYLVGSYRK